MEIEEGSVSGQIAISKQNYTRNSGSMQHSTETETPTKSKQHTTLAGALFEVELLYF